MKKIYLPFMALMALGSLNAQNLMKSAGRTQSFVKYGQSQQSTVAPSSLRSMDATLNETFEAGVPPAGWSGDWLPSTADTYEETSATGATGHFAFTDPWNDAVGVERSLITPTLQPVAGTNTLSYDINYYNLSTNTAYQGSGIEIYIEFSTDGGTTWTTSTTNVAASLPNYNTTTNSGWINQSVSLAAYNGMNVMVRFRSVSDYGWSNLGIDNVTGPNVLLLTNDIAVTPSPFLQIDGFDYFQVIPNSQLTTVDFGVITSNIGSTAQTNVTLTADMNGGSFVGSTGLNNPTPSMASGAFDTLWTSVMPTGTGFTPYATRLSVSQTEIDSDPTNNVADSVLFYGTDYSFYRTVNIGAILSSYSFGASAPAITGMEYGATYITPNIGRVDSITTLIYKNSGAGNVVGKLYTIDPITGTFLNVASTAAFTPPTGVNSALNLTTLALTTPFVVPAGTLLAASIQLNITVPGDTIYIGSDNTFLGDPAVAGLVWVKPAAGSFQWSSITGQVPIVGIEMANPAIGIADNTASDMISVYPNPSTGMFTLNMGKNVKSTVEVYNVIGAKIEAKEFNSQISSIDLSGLEAGVYFLKVTSDNKQITKQITITK